MSTTINTGGPAFPAAEQHGPNNGMPGMTLRDYFAGLALQGLCANSGGPFQANGRNGWDIVNCNPEDIAGCAYGLADAMLAAREAA